VVSWRGYSGVAQPVDDLLTTRQLQDLLRVDRITIYRMLNDGRLRGFKVGGLWRFPRREIEAWLQEQQAGLGRTSTSLLSAESPASSSRILPMICIQAMQAVCAEALDIAVVTTRPDGTPLADVSNSCEFCTLILSTELGQLRCAESWRQAPDGQFHPCHAGLLYVSFPVVVAGQPQAIAAACQFTSPGPNGADPTWQLHLPELAAGIDLAEAELRAAVGSVRAIPANHLPRISRLLRRVADSFAEIGQERVNLLGRLEKIAEMSRI
jgi:excisionase family DNA binding protein